MKTYVFERTIQGCRVSVLEGGRKRPLRPRLDLRRHSPAGYEAGYEGSGPAQLSLAICADALGDDARALDIYQEFKRSVVATLRTDHWRITQTEVRAVCMALAAGLDPNAKYVVG